MPVPAETATGSGAAGGVEAVYARIARRIMPVLILLFVIAWLDRVNVGFARLQMLADRGFSDAVFGFGAGVFYFGYLLFELPSNLWLQRIGARKTLARIALLWGVTSIATMFVKTAMQFYVLRFMLGAFEAGLYPGVILYHAMKRIETITATGWVYRLTCVWRWRTVGSSSTSSQVARRPLIGRRLHAIERSPVHLRAAGRADAGSVNGADHEHAARRRSRRERRRAAGCVDHREVPCHERRTDRRH